MKSFYTDELDWTEEARTIDREVSDALKPIYEKWIGMGHSAREITYVILGASYFVEAFTIVRKNIEKRKKARGE